MVNLIVGPKGCGKTKKFIELTNNAANANPNCVVCIEKGSVSMFSVSYLARLIDIDEFPKVNTYDGFFAYLSGLISGNYDIREIFIDSILRICGRDMTEFTRFVVELKEFAKTHNVTFTLTVSSKKDNVPAEALAVANELIALG
jgi:hypothetical protein